MHTTHFIEEVLGQKSKVAVLRILLREGEVTGRSASRKARLSTRAAQLALQDLERVGVVRRRILGGTHVFSLNEKRFGVIEGLRSLFQVETALPAALAERLWGWLPKGKTVSLGIFGSAARGESRPGSDLDIVVIVSDAASAAAASSALESRRAEFSDEFGASLSPFILSRRDLLERFDRKEPLIQNMIRESWILRGKSLGQVIADDT